MAPPSSEVAIIARSSDEAAIMAGASDELAFNSIDIDIAPPSSEEDEALEAEDEELTADEETALDDELELGGALDELGAGALELDDDAAGGVLLLHAASVRPMASVSGTVASSFMRMMVMSSWIAVYSYGPSPGESGDTHTLRTAFLP